MRSTTSRVASFIALASVAACSDGGGAPIDAPPLIEDSMPDAFDCAGWTAASTHFGPCQIPEPLGPLELGPGVYTYDTMDGVLSGPNGDPIAHASRVIGQEEPPVPPPAPDARPGTTYSSYRVVSVTSLRIPASARLNAIGRNPLLIVAWGDIDIEGIIDASSRLGVQEGAGFRPYGEGGSLHGDVQAFGYSGGGGGGGFQASGGGGGTALNGARAGGPAGPPEPPPTRILGGCDGGIGGITGSSPSVWADGGRGGGAVQLTANGRITISGQVLANGSGGEGGPTLPPASGGGGGGGGSGGYVGLEAPAIIVTGRLAANGGGGGEGASSSVAGDHGEDGRADATSATGGDMLTACGTAGAAGGGIRSPAGWGRHRAGRM